ncbi:hypothetical protein LJR084_001936 [Variovorax sp. LjRoot84]|uniref:hypothetical protein n=1 Tax=Variovorax sp. LjRoot84 TaxID=3342340 RepID=UPI003ECE1C1B
MTYLIVLSPLVLVLLGLREGRNLWLYFIAAMRLKEMRDAGTLTKEQRYLGYSLLAEGLLLDFAFNVVFGSWFFWEHPFRREFTLSARIWRLSNLQPHPDNWRQRRALRWRKKLLDSGDPKGIHQG